MPKNSIIKYALLNSLWTALYVILIVLFISSGQAIFGPHDTILIPMAMLMLFVFSAAFCGALFLGRPILWYLDGNKKEAITLFVYTLGFFLVVMLAVLFAMYLLK